MTDKQEMLSRFSILSAGENYTIIVDGADGAGVELTATPEQIDEVIKALSRRLSEDHKRPPLAPHSTYPS